MSDKYPDQDWIDNLLQNQRDFATYPESLVVGPKEYEALEQELEDQEENG